MSRVEVLKTYKVFINGQFVRSESGRYYKAVSATGKNLANVCRCSRKDVRDAVKAARAAFPGWWAKSAYNRAQILYRAAEELEGRKEQFVAEISRTTNGNPEAEVEKAIDRLIWYAGWADKYFHIFGTANTVSHSMIDTTTPEPTGVVAVVVPSEFPLLAFVSKVAPAVLTGNTAVVAIEQNPLPALSFAEVIAASDFPAGVINVLSGSKKEILPHLCSHMDVNAIDYSGPDRAEIESVQKAAAINVKRCIIRKHPAGDEWLDDKKAQDLYWILPYLEMKTVWHPTSL